MALVRALFLYTGAQSVWTVPAGVTSATFECYGARGGSSGWISAQGYVMYSYPSDQTFDSLYSGEVPQFYDSGVMGSNPGGYAAGTKTVTPGENYYVYVGGHGQTANVASNSGNALSFTGGKGGYNGGGKGGNGYQAAGHPTSTFSQYPLAAGGGGGATDIRYGGTAAANRILVAGGSGGEGGGTQSALEIGQLPSNFSYGTNPSSPTPPYFTTYSDYFSTTNVTNLKYVSAGTGHGGYGGPTGGDGGLGVGTGGGNNTGTSGRGATISAGGAGGTDTQTGGVNGSAGTSATGGAGGNATNATANAGNGWGMGGGGGGGGYYGGGGGATGNDTIPNGGGGCGAGGGGGSNYVSATLTNPLSYAHAAQHDYTYEGASTFTDYSAAAQGSYALISYVQPPNLPSNLSLQSGEAIQAGVDLPVSWTWSSSAPSPDNPTDAYPSVADGGADIAWSVHGANSWTQAHVSGAANNQHSYTIPGASFTGGTSYDIRVRLYDNYGDVGSWLMVTVAAVALPPTPNITSPAEGASVTPSGTAPNYTVPISWTMNGATSPELTFDLTLASSKNRKALGPIKTNSRLNLSPNPDCADATGWSGVGWATIAAQTTYFKYSPSALKSTWTTGAINAYQQQTISTYPQSPYTFSVWVAAGTNASTDPGVYLQAVDAASGTVLAQSPLTSAWGSLGTFQRLNVQFYAAGATTYLQIVTADGVAVPASSSTIIDAVLAEVGISGNSAGTLDPLPYFGKTKHDAAVTGTFTTSGGFAAVTNPDVLTYNIPWPYGSDSVTATLYTSTLSSAGGESAQAAQRHFALSIAPPGVPTVSVASDDDAGTITLTMTANNVPNPTTWFDVYRTDPRTGVETALALTVFPDDSGVAVFVDYTPASGVLYSYRVRAHSALGFVDVT